MLCQIFVRSIWESCKIINSHVGVRVIILPVVLILYRLFVPVTSGVPVTSVLPVTRVLHVVWYFSF